MDGSVEPKRGRAAPFLPMWGGKLLALVGNRVVQFALLRWITTTLGSSAALADASLLVILPQIIISPLVGTLADRWSRKPTMIGADMVMFVAADAPASLRASH